MLTDLDPSAIDILMPPLIEVFPRDLGRPEKNLPFAGLVCAAHVRPEAVSWVWDYWLPADSLAIVAGAPGTGKTTVALAMVAIVSRGGRWPDGTRCEAGDAVIWSGEDVVNKTLVPRLIAMGADLKRVHFVVTAMDSDGSRPFDPAIDLPLLEQAFERDGIKPRIVIVDPIVSAVAADSHKNGEVRRALQPLVDLAHKHGCAVLGITHFSKGTAGRDPTERVTGSIAFSALARVVMATAKLPEDEGGGRLLVRSKSNLGPDDGGFRYDIHQTELPGHPGVFASQVLWGEALEGSAREILGRAETTAEGEADGERQEVKRWLCVVLADGPQTAKRIQGDAAQAGYSWATVRRAQKSLGIKPTKAGMSGPWEWRLPEEAHENTEYAQQNNVSAFGRSEHLRDEQAPGSTFVRNAITVPKLVPLVRPIDIVRGEL